MSDIKRRAESRMIGELRRFQDDLVETWLDRSLPDDWNGLETREPVPPPREKVTLRLDADMIKWFRRLGPGYGRRINSVLRIYWEALISGRIMVHEEEDEDQISPQLLDYILKRADREG